MTTEEYNVAVDELRAEVESLGGFLFFKDLVRGQTHLFAVAPKGSTWKVNGNTDIMLARRNFDPAGRDRILLRAREMVRKGLS